MTITGESITAERLDELLVDDSIATVHRALWLLLWEGELRVLDLLSLDVQDVDLEQRRISTTSQSAAPDRRPDFSDRAARLLREVIGDRESGPLFAVSERALSWEEAVQVADKQGHAIHAFRACGRLHRHQPD